MNKIENNLKPHVAIVCGSGLGEIADLVQDKQIIPYSDIPEFPRSTGENNFYMFRFYSKN